MSVAGAPHSALRVAPGIAPPPDGVTFILKGFGAEGYGSAWEAMMPCEDRCLTVLISKVLVLPFKREVST